jgi:hypothetical protein
MTVGRFTLAGLLRSVSGPIRDLDQGTRSQEEQIMVAMIFIG